MTSLRSTMAVAATRLLLSVLALGALALGASPPAFAQARPEVDLTLVLALDVSGSINEERWQLEKRGYADAFRSAEVVNAITQAPIGAVAVALVQWAHPNEQRTIIDWTVVRSAADAGKLADQLEDMPRAFRGRTSISMGVRFSTDLLRGAPFDSVRKVIDVSGDGPDNTSTAYNYEGYVPFGQGTPADAEEVRRVRDAAVEAGIVINGLPIFGDPRAGQIDDYYRQNVIGGPGSFIVVARSFQDFATAIRRKLVQEIGARPGGGRADFALAE
jgi:hypothetical protein